MEIDDENNVWLAAGDGDLEAVFEFLKGSPTVDVPDSNGYTPLMASASYGHLALVRALLERGADPNRIDSDGNTSLHHCDYPDSLRALLEAGGKPSIRNNDGQTALDMKQEELAEADSDDEEDLAEGELPASQRLKSLVEILLEASTQEELRKKRRD